MSHDPRKKSPPPPSHGAPPRGARPGEEQRKLETVRRAIASVPPSRERGVLVVEDDPDLQWRLARMLTVRGNRVVGTSSAEAAIEVMRHWPVDLVLADDGLPGMSGVDLALYVSEHHPSTTVVVMSSEATEEAHLAARLAGVAAVLAKPFAFDSLLDLLRSLPDELDLGELDLGEPELAPAE